MAYRVELAARAAADLEALFLLKEVYQSPTAARWYNGLQAAIWGLAEFPQRCPFAPDTGKTLVKPRNLLYGTKPNIYRVIFDIDEENSRVRVFAIRHGARKKLSAIERFTSSED